MVYNHKIMILFHLRQTLPEQDRGVWVVNALVNWGPSNQKSALATTLNVPQAPNLHRVYRQWSITIKSWFGFISIRLCRNETGHTSCECIGQLGTLKHKICLSNHIKFSTSTKLAQSKKSMVYNHKIMFSFHLRQTLPGAYELSMHYSIGDPQTQNLP